MLLSQYLQVSKINYMKCQKNSAVNEPKTSQLDYDDIYIGLAFLSFKKDIDSIDQDYGSIKYYFKFDSRCKIPS